jgi:hypothetical protein
MNPLNVIVRGENAKRRSRKPTVKTVRELAETLSGDY